MLHFSKSTLGRCAHSAGPSGTRARERRATPRRSTGEDRAYVRPSPCPPAFDTRVRGPFGKAAPAIAEALEQAGYAPVAAPTGFLVTGKSGPRKKGELERARRWGSEIAAAVTCAAAAV